VATAGILIIGDEILSGEVQDENAPLMVRAFAEWGVGVARVVTVPDEKGAIVEELCRLRALADLVVVSGGLGPTHDDLTRPAVAEALGLPMERHAEAAQRIRAWYGDETTAAELAMADLPRGAELLDGAKTSTFGFLAGGLAVLPGVPALFRDIAAGLPGLLPSEPLAKAELHTDRREGEIAPALAEVQGRYPDVAIGSYPTCNAAGWHVRIVLRARDPVRLEEAEAAIRPLL